MGDLTDFGERMLEAVARQTGQTVATARRVLDLMTDAHNEGGALIINDDNKLVYVSNNGPAPADLAADIEALYDAIWLLLPAFHRYVNADADDIRPPSLRN